jgi:hypothetical protein
MAENNMHSNEDETLHVIRIVFLRCLIAFVLITLVGLLLMHTYNTRMHTIQIGCGLNVNADTDWVTNCTNTYSRHHMGDSRWWAPVFVIGAMGLVVTLVALGATLFLGKQKRAL